MSYTDLEQFIGLILPYGGETVASDTPWLLCDGSNLDSVANSKYAKLYSIVGIIYGGTGADDFNLPDLRGTFIRGRDYDGSGVDVDTRAVGSMQTHSMKRHCHRPKAYCRVTNCNTNIGTVVRDTVNKSFCCGGIENRPLNVTLNYIIKYK